MNILIISDGKPGHQNQSLGIAERLPGGKVLLFKHGLKEGLGEGMLRWGVGRARGKVKSEIARKRLVEIASQKELEEIERFAPNIIISAGTTSATVNLLFKAFLTIPSVCIMRPSMIPLSSFELVVIPAHDRVPNLPNVVHLVITPNRASPEMAKAQAEEFSGRTGLKFGDKYLGIIIGGKAKGLSFNVDTCLDMLDTCYRWAREHDIILLLTTSRRTGSALESTIEERWGDDQNTGYLLLAGRDKENPTYAFHGLAGRVLITADSMSMVSEAVYAGVKPLVVDVSGGSALFGKRGRFYDGLRSGGFVDFISDSDDLPRALQMTQPFAGAGVPDELKLCLRRIIELVEQVRPSDSIPE